MLDAKAIDLHYGAAQALRGVSLQAEIGEVIEGLRKFCGA